MAIDSAEVTIAMTQNGWYLEEVTFEGSEMSEESKAAFPSVILAIINNRGENPCFIYCQKPVPDMLSDEEID
jgi:hypothetical protein